MGDHGGNLGELFDRVTDLPVEDEPIGYHDHRVEERLATVLQPDELVGEPRDGVALAAARRVLDEVPVAHSAYASIRQKLAHDVELVEPREDLFLLLLSRPFVLLLHNLRVVLKDVSQSLAGKNIS